MTLDDNSLDALLRCNDLEPPADFTRQVMRQARAIDCQNAVATSTKTHAPMQQHNLTLISSTAEERATRPRHQKPPPLLQWLSLGAGVALGTTAVLRLLLGAWWLNTAY